MAHTGGEGTVHRFPSLLGHTLLPSLDKTVDECLTKDALGNSCLYHTFWNLQNIYYVPGNLYVIDMYMKREKQSMI